MTESDWAVSTEPEQMRQFICNRTNDRKRLLYMVAWCRCSKQPTWDRRSWEAVEVAERYADGLASDKEFRRAECAALLVKAVPMFMGYHYRAYHTQYALLLRDVVGNPFRPLPSLDSAWLAWNDRTIPRLSESIYEERSLPGGTLDAARLGILADALEDAGCTQPDLLSHLRWSGPHVRGCWVVDLLSGRG